MANKEKEEDSVQEIIDKADREGYDAFVIDYHLNSQYKFGKVWFKKNCWGEIEASDLEHDKWGNKNAFIRKTRACKPLPQIQYEPDDEGVSYNIGDVAENLYDTIWLDDFSETIYVEYWLN